MSKMIFKMKMTRAVELMKVMKVLCNAIYKLKYMNQSSNI